MANKVRILRPQRGEVLERIGARERTAQATCCGSSTRYPNLERGGQGGIVSPALRRRAIFISSNDELVAWLGNIEVYSEAKFLRRHMECALQGFARTLTQGSATWLAIHARLVGS